MGRGNEKEWGGIYTVCEKSLGKEEEGKIKVSM